MLSIKEYYDASSGSLRYKIYLTKGDTFRVALTLEDAVGKDYELKEKESLTFAVKMIGREDTPLYQYTVDPRFMEIYIPSEVTDTLRTRSYVWDIEARMANGDVLTVASGHLIIEKEVVE